MDLLLTQHSNLISRLRRTYSTVKVEELKQFFDNLVELLKTLTYTNKNIDGLNILTIICDDLASMHNLQLFDHPVLINHPIFIYIGRTLEMLLTKCTHSQSIPMKKSEENCFYSISYLVTQLCWHRNGPIASFYGSISSEIFPVTGKINVRDETIGENSRKSNPIAGKLNVKVSALPPSAPKSRPIEESPSDITKIIHRKKFPNKQLISTSDQAILVLPPLPTDLPIEKYQDVFLTKSFFEKLIRAIDDLSQSDYSPYHIKYKVIDRLIRLCSKLNMVDALLDPIIKCLRSKFYRQACTIIESEQFCLTPKQLFFINRCPQFIIHHEFKRQEQIPSLLCQAMIEITKSMIDIVLLPNEEMPDATNNDRDIARHALHCHLELLNHFSLTATGRRYFLQSHIMDQMIEILRDVPLHPKDNLLFHPNIGVIANALMLLNNLAYEKEIFSMLKRRDLQDILEKLQSSEDYLIQFALETLGDILGKDQIDQGNEPMKLKNDYIEYLQKLMIESEHTVRAHVVRDIKERKNNKPQVVFTELFFEKLIRDINELSKNDNPSDKSIYKTASWRVRVCTKHVSMTESPSNKPTDKDDRTPDKRENKKVKELLNAILECLDSKFYLEVFEKIELNQTKTSFGAVLNKRSLANKHLFFMRECPEFLFRHDYRQYDEIANSLGKKMLGYTTTIFGKHLPVLFSTPGKIESEESSEAVRRARRASKKGPDADEGARMEALSYHIKMLTHFTQTRMMRREFFRTSIVDQILSILQDKTLFDNPQAIPDAKLEVIGQSLILLYNLALEEEIYSKLQTEKFLDICNKLSVFKDKTIHFSSHILSIMLDKEIHENIEKPDLLSKTSIEYINKSVQEPKQLYQGIKLDGLLKNLRIIVQNESFIESFVHKEGIPAITECTYANRDEELNPKMTRRIQKAAIDIVWRLSCYGPTISKKLKENDKFVDQLLILSDKSPLNFKKVANSIIWRLGSMESNREERRGETADDDQLPSTDEWDESIPYDLLISYSNNVTDQVLSLKIYNRLIKKGYRVYTEKPGKHRLEVMQKAIAQEKPILACLSKSYRSSKICLAEIECAQKQSCPIIPAIVEPKFKIQGWLKHILGGKIPIDFTDKKFDENLIILCVEIEKFKSSD